MSEKRESKASVVLQVRIKPVGMEALNRWAAEEGIDRSEFVRRLLREEGVARTKGRSLIRPRTSNS